MADAYDISDENRLRQLREHGSYDRRTVHAILDAALVAQVGFLQHAAPVVVPMIYGRRGETIYLHGARKARIIQLLLESPRACLNVTLVDGLVLARSAFNSSLQYRSVTVFGAPRLIDGPEEKLDALRVISEHVMPGRWEELRAPLEREIKMTGIIELTIESASAKVSASMPADEEDDYASAVWAGILPLRSAFTELRADDRLLPGVEPSAAIRALQGTTL